MDIMTLPNSILNLDLFFSLVLLLGMSINLRVSWMDLDTGVIWEHIVVVVIFRTWEAAEMRQRSS